MKVVHITTSISGGAGRAASRLHYSLLAAGLDSNILCMNAEEEDSNIYKHPANKITYLTKVRNKLGICRTQSYKHHIFHQKFFNPEYGIFTFAKTDYRLHKHPLVKEADVVNLHWVACFLDYPSFFRNINKPVVWTLHDRNPFLGGFHHGLDVDKSDSAFTKLNEEQRIIKRDSIHKKKDLYIVAPSRWMKEYSEKSEIFSHYTHLCIPNSIDTNIFTPRNKTFCRALFNAKPDSKLILFLCPSLNNKYKGFEVLLKSMQCMKNPNYSFIAAGQNEIRDENLPINFIGSINDDRLLSCAYSGADVCVNPTLEDNFPNTVLESLACGTPVIGSNVGGIPDMVREGITGMLFEPGNPKDLANKIEKFFLLPEEEKRRMSENCRRIAIEEYAPEVQAKAYKNLYEEILLNAKI
jgi:glycosyltransferase involved in cell wall biosynthesis